MRTFAAPCRYLQGPGALDRLGDALAAYGSPLLVMDDVVHGLLGGRLLEAFRDVRPRVVVATGEITYELIDRLERESTDSGADIVVGIGGGKILDTAKALSTRWGVPVATVPTIASNDSPTSSAIAMYNDSHEMVSVDHTPLNPVVVVVDTQLIASAPAVFLRAGIGDAISKKWEADACAVGTGLTPLGTRPLGIAQAIGDRCYEVLRADSAAALADCEAHVVTPALERVVEAVVLLSGLAFENGGLSVAHSLTRGLMRARGASGLPHGFHVAWGALVQLAAEGCDTEQIRDLAAFLRDIGLPICAADLRLEGSLDVEFSEIARHTMTAPHLLNFPVAVTPDLLIAAQWRVEEIAASV